MNGNNKEIMMINLTIEEKKILMPEYNKYLAWYKKWMIPEAIPLLFDDWWREMADNAKEQREGK